MPYRISEFWEKSINRPGSLAVSVAVWAVMLGGVIATTQLNTMHVAGDRSYVEHEPAVAASIRQKYIGQSKTVDETPAVETASVSIPQHPHSTVSALQVQNIPVPAPRPSRLSIKVLPLLATRDVPIPSIGRDQSCREGCDQMVMNAPMMNQEVSSLDFDESPILEGPVERYIPNLSQLKEITAAVSHPLDLLKPLAQRN